MEKKIFIITLIFTILSIIIFFIPNQLTLFSFSGVLLFSGEVWRLLTFSFSHVNLPHLIENIITLSIISFLAYELDIKGKHFLLTFTLSALIIALTEAALFPALIIAGLSLGIYALLGSLTLKGNKYISKFITIPVLGATVFVKYLFSAVEKNTLEQAYFHLAGFIVGIIVFYSLTKFKKKRRILQWNESKQV